MNQSIRPQLRKAYYDPDDPGIRRIRRFFGIDFMLVLIVVICGLYFVWPLMFKEKENFIAESAVRDAYSVIQLVKEYAAGLNAATRDETVVALKSHPAFAQTEKENAVRLFLIDAAGNKIFGNADLPDYWDEVKMKTLTNPRDFFVYKTDEVLSLVFVETLDGAGLRLVAVRRSPKVFGE